MKKFASLVLVAALSLFASPVFAATTVAEFTGTLTVTVDGVTTTYQPGDTVPEIPSGATIAVEGGSASLAVGKVAVTLPAGGSVKATSSSNGKTAKVAVLTGSATVAGKPVPAGKTASAQASNAGVKQAAQTDSATVADSKVTVTIVTSNPNQDQGVSCQAGVSPSAPCNS